MKVLIPAEKYIGETTMKKLILLLLLTTMVNCALADRYYGPSGKMPYVKSSNHAYQKSWNSYAKHVNISINVARTRAVADRLMGHRNGVSGHGTAAYAEYGDQSPSEFQKCVNSITSDPSKGVNTNAFKVN